MNSLTMLVHGPSKAGKSNLCASTPAPRVLLDVEAAARFLPIRQPVLRDNKGNPMLDTYGNPIYQTWDGSNPPPEPDGTWDTVVAPILRWQDAVNVLKWLQSGKHPFRSAGLDSVSELQARYLEHVAGRGQVKLQDWGGALRELRGFVSDLRDLTVHPTNPMEAVVVTSMSKVATDGRAYPWLQGQMATVIPYLMDIIAYIDVVPDPNTGEERRFIYTRKTKTYLAGERVGGRIPPTLQLPDISGTTLEEIAEKNNAYSNLIKLVYAMHSQHTIAAPAAVDTSDSPFTYHPPAQAEGDLPLDTTKE